MSAARVLPFSLPGEPINGHEVRWWSVEFHGRSAPRVIECRAVYHVHRRWEDLFPPDGRPPGAAFTDEWQVFRGDHFVSRAEGWGWSSHQDPDAWRLTFGARRLAIERAVEIVMDAIRSTEEKLDELRAALSAFTSEASP